MLAYDKAMRERMMAHDKVCPGNPIRRERDEFRSDYERLAEELAASQAREARLREEIGELTADKNALRMQLAMLLKAAETCAADRDRLREALRLAVTKGGAMCPGQDGMCPPPPMVRTT